MLRLARYNRWAFQVKYPTKAPSLLFSFSTSAAESAPPIRVGLTESSGRGVFASRRIGTGDLIHTAQPIISHPSLSSLYTVCYFCLQKLPINSGVLQNVSFCSKRCEEKSKGLKYPLLVKRLACQVISGVVTPDVLDILQPEILTSEKVSLMKKDFALLRRNLEDSSIESDQMAFVTEGWYTAVLARIRINAFRIEYPGGSYEDLLSLAAASVEAEAAVGNAVYMLPSLYNHDCDPNANIFWTENVDAQIKARRDIEQGEELRICYIDASMDYEARQNILYEGFGFRCNCLRCESKD
ncbi:hypothetical protein RD792_012659 [Penstemon davidsonii]|uniref:SET domain-containing protein n=1 Tax=Penstemon davidsonii TaxID=160366 RepID=A0ABR0CXH6_9LAMI|nr:hypothetical protein RD792_012659 [Penstemon davidsonii]